MRINQILTLLFMLLFMPLKAKECGVLTTAGYILEFKANYSELLTSDELEEWADLASLILASGEQALSSFQKDFKVNELLSADQVRAKLAEVRTLTAAFNIYREALVKSIRSNQAALVMAIESVPDQETTDFSIDDLCRMAGRLINVGLALDQSYLLDPDLLHVDPEFRDRLWHDCTSFEDLTVVDPFGVLPEMFKFLKNSAFEKDKNKHFRITRMRLYKMRSRFSSYNSGKGKYQFIYHNCKPNDFKKLLFPGTVGGNLVDGMNKTDFQQCFMVWAGVIYDKDHSYGHHRYLSEVCHEFYKKFYEKVVILEGFFGNKVISEGYFDSLEQLLYDRLLIDLKSLPLFTEQDVERNQRMRRFGKRMYETNYAEFGELLPHIDTFHKKIIEEAPKEELERSSNYHNVLFGIKRLEGFMEGDFRLKKENPDLIELYKQIFLDLYRSMKKDELSYLARFEDPSRLAEFSPTEQAILQFVFYSVNTGNFYFGKERSKKANGGNLFIHWKELRQDPVLVSLYNQALYQMQGVLGLKPEDAKKYFTNDPYFSKVTEDEK